MTLRKDVSATLPLLQPPADYFSSPVIPYIAIGTS